MLRLTLSNEIEILQKESLLFGSTYHLGPVSWFQQMFFGRKSVPALLLSPRGRCRPSPSITSTKVITLEVCNPLTKIYSASVCVHSIHWEALVPDVWPLHMCAQHVYEIITLNYNFWCKSWVCVVCTFGGISWFRRLCWEIRIIDYKWRNE